MKRRAFIDRMASAVIGVGLLGAALRSRASVDFEVPERLALTHDMVGQTIVVTEGEKFSSRCLEVSDEGEVQPNFPFEDDLVPRRDNYFFV